MASIPVYQIWVAGTVVTAAQLIANIQTPGNFWLAKPFANVYNNAGVAVASSTLVLVPYDTETEDNDAMHSTSTNPSRVICQTPGLFLLNAGQTWPANNSLINRRFVVRLNSGGSGAGGTLVVAFDSASASTGAASTGNNNVPSGSFFYRMVNIGDYLETFAWQTLGSSITTVGGAGLTYFQMGWWNA